MIDRGGSVRQSTVAAMILGFNRWRCLCKFEHKADSLIVKFKSAGGNWSERRCMEQSPRLTRSKLSASSSACHGLLIITVITPLPTKPGATKMWELKLANGNYWQQMRQRDVAALDAKYTKELADAKAENDALWWCCRWSSSVAHQSSLSVSVKPPPPPAWTMQLPPTGRHRWTGLFHLRERLITMQNNWKEPRSILMSSADRAPISMGTMQLLWAIHTRFQRSINA